MDYHRITYFNHCYVSVVPEVDPQFEQNTKQTVKPKKAVIKRKKREIRVFVSSTFRDFKQEREQLIKKTFREINGICSERGVFFTYVDLRWGITSEQTKHGQTIAICLQEVKHYNIISYLFLLSLFCMSAGGKT